MAAVVIVLAVVRCVLSKRLRVAKFSVNRKHASPSSWTINIAARAVLRREVWFVVLCCEGTAFSSRMRESEALVLRCSSWRKALTSWARALRERR